MSQRRSGRACLACRKRKVRCDVLTTGIPCSNCIGSGSCFVSTIRNSRVSSRASNNTLLAEHVHLFQLDSPLSPAERTHAVLNFSRTTQRTPESLYSGKASTVLSLQPQAEHFVLPGYITPIADANISTLRFLHSEGALRFPERATFDEIAHAYLYYVHPMLPFLELRVFLDAIKGENSQSLSPTLAQAIIFVSSAFLTNEKLQILGFEDRSEARRILFRRVRLLFETDLESDRMILVQVLLLMTYWYGQQNDVKGRFYWLRNALSFATEIGVHLSHAEPVTRPRTYARRRTWYCCVLRSTLLSITERRQCGDLKHFVQNDVRSQEELFDSDAVNEMNQFYQAHYSTSGSTLIELWLIKVRLCLIANRVLETQYESRGRRRLVSGEYLMVLVPRVSKESQLQALDIDGNLIEWQATANALQHSCFDQDHRCNGRILGVQSATLEMLYYTVLSMLHRPLIQEDTRTNSALAFLQPHCKQKLRFAARRITEVGRQMLDARLAQFLPPIAVGACIVASVQHLKDVVSGDVELKTTGCLFLNQTIDTLSVLKDTYNSATCALTFIDHVRNGHFRSHSFEWADEADGDGEGHSRHRSQDPQPDTIINLNGQQLHVGLGSRINTDRHFLDTDGNSVAALARAAPNWPALLPADFSDLFMFESSDLYQTDWQGSDLFQTT